MAPGWFLLGTPHSIRINHKTSSIPRNTLLSKSTGLMAKQSMSLVFFRDHSRILMSMYSFTPNLHFTYIAGGGPRVVVSTAAFHARVRGSVPGLGGLKETKNVWRTVSSQSSHHPQEVLLAQFSLYVHKGALKPDSFHFIHIHCTAINNASETS